MHYHLVLTQRCNLSCTYCGSSVESSIMPVNLDYSIEHLKSFFDKDQEQPVIAFYGGEPCLEEDRIIQIMDMIPAKAFTIQTNGTLLTRIPTEYIYRFQSILVSIDGREEVTDGYRGSGTFTNALAGAKYALNSGFQGDLIARMTVSETSDIYQDVKFLLSLNDPPFSHVHWQLDAMWDESIETRYSYFEEWLTNSYIPGITQLVKMWLDLIKTTGHVPGIVPFQGIMHTLLSGIAVQLRCGAGIDFFSINTDGMISVCPIPPSVDFAKVGDIYHNIPSDLPGKVMLDEPCLSCEERTVCGGRCLYTNKTKHWGEEGFELVCKVTKHLISELRLIKTDIQRLIQNRQLSINDFHYPKIANGVEIIP
ncbi:MAG: TIGR04084 family radical SAM/SPASM domain-containing protein [Candidatus Kariarchaeaceae archaeon]